MAILSIMDYPGQNPAQVRRGQGRPHQREGMADTCQQVQRRVHGGQHVRRWCTQSRPLLPHLLVQSPNPLPHSQ